MHLYQWSCFFLGATSVSCLIGLASPRFRENLFMCLGMCLLSAGSASRAVELAELQPVIPWDWFMVHAGVGLFSLGMFFDVFLIARRAQLLEFAHSVITARWLELHHPTTARARNNPANNPTDR